MLDDTSVGVIVEASAPPLASSSSSWIEKVHPESLLFPPPSTTTAGCKDDSFPNPPSPPPPPPVRVVVRVVVIVVVHRQQAVRPWTCPVEELAHEGVVQAAIARKHASQQDTPYQWMIRMARFPRGRMGSHRPPLLDIVVVVVMLVGGRRRLVGHALQRQPSEFEDVNDVSRTTP
jgi:hypothetical protein